MTSPQVSDLSGSRCRSRARTTPAGVTGVGCRGYKPLTCGNALCDRWTPLSVCGHLADFLRTEGR